MNFLGIGSGTHPLSTFVGALFGGVSSIVGAATSGAAAIGNSAAGAALGAGLAGGITGNPKAVTAGLNAANKKNAVVTGEGYTVPLTTNWFTEWHKITSTKMYILDANGYPQMDWTKIVLSSLGGVALVWGIYELMKPKKRRASRRSTSKRGNGRRH